MQDRLHGIARVLGALSNAALWIASIGMIAMTAMVALQVFSRYVLVTPHALCWTDECFDAIAREGLGCIVDLACGRTPRSVIRPS